MLEATPLPSSAQANSSFNYLWWYCFNNQANLRTSIEEIFQLDQECEEPNGNDICTLNIAKAT